MKIQANPHHQYVYKNHIKGNCAQLPFIYRKDKTCELKKANPSLLNVYFGINFKGKDLGYSPITSTEPAYSPCCNNYNNTDEFADKFEKKLNSELQNPSIEDINKLISEIKLQTGADDKLILETLFRLTQFSSYKSSGIISQTIKDLNLYAPSILKNNNMLNSVFRYIFWEKFDFYSDNSNSFPIFLNSDWLKNIKNTRNLNEYDYSKFCLLDGFEVKASNGKYYGANFLSGTGYLKSLATDIINRAQKGQATLDDALNGDIISRTNKLFPDKKIEIIKANMPDNITSEDILENLKNSAPSREYIKDTIIRLSQITPPNDTSGLSKEERRVAIMKYLDNFTYAFSPESIALALRKIKNELDILEKKSGRKNVYYIPDSSKSNVLINYMFQKVNDVDSNSFVFNMENFSSRDNIIILDDMSVSGLSQVQIRNHLASEMDYTDGISYLDAKFYYYSIISANSKPLQLDSNCISRAMYVTQSSPEKIFKTFTDKECEYLSAFSSRYKNCMTGIAMPYMIPDNDSYISSYILSPILYKNTILSNKGMSHAGWKPLNEEKEAEIPYFLKQIF